MRRDVRGRKPGPYSRSRNARGRILACGLGVLVWGLASSAAPSFTTSSSGRFLVVGSDSALNVEYARWAENMAEHCETLLDSPLPLRRGKPMEILLVDSRTAGMDVTTGRRDDGRYTLTIPRPSTGETALLREAFVRLMLEGLIESQRQDTGRPSTEIIIPSWFLAGLSGNLEKEMLAGHRTLLSMPGIESGGATSITEVIQWVSLPEGWQGPRALCSLATAWFLTFPRALSKMRDRLDAGAPLSPAWLAQNVVGVASIPRMEELWRAWRERQDRAIQEFGVLSTGLILELKGIPHLSGSSLEKIQWIRTLTLGKAPELVEVGELYCRYFEAVSRGAWKVTQRRRLARAEVALGKLETLTQAREAYVDDFESLPRRGGDPAASGLEKSAMESYLDEAEKRLDKR